MLLFVLALNSAGYLTGYLLLKKIVKEYTLSSISDNPAKWIKNITVLSFTENNPISIISTRKEIVYQNKIYDIIKAEKAGTVTNYYCIEDKREEALDDLLGDKENSSEDNPLESSVNIFLKNIDTNALVYNFNVFPAFSEKRITYAQLLTIYIEPSNQVLIPPPRVLHS